MDSTNKLISFKGPRGSLRNRCSVCFKLGGVVYKCESCDVVQYCSRQHRLRHMFEHKLLCDDVRMWLGLVDQPLSQMRAPRCRLAMVYQRIGTRDSVQKAVDQMLHILLASVHSDSQWDLQFRIPTIMLRLDRDQECYEFITWWCASGEPLLPNPEQQHHLREYRAPLLFSSIQDIDVFEDVNYLCRSNTPDQHIALVLLLKMKLLIDIIQLKLVRKVIGPRIPPEIWTDVDTFVIRSSISQQFIGQTYGAITATQQKLEKQVKILLRCLEDRTGSFLQVLLHPTPYLLAAQDRPGAMQYGSHGATAAFLEASYPVWCEHEGVIELLKSAETLAAMDAREQLAECVATSSDQPKSKELELSERINNSKLSLYINQAVEDALSLGVVKPSELRRQGRRPLQASLHR